MTRIAHLSDLHFGRTDPALIENLVAAVTAARPDLVVISGDLTQRARIAQFAAARRFIGRMPAPVLAVPGNHDTPLDNPFLRFLAPWRRWRRGIGPELEPEYRDDAVVVIGVNSVNPWAWQQGRMPRSAIRRTREAFAGAGSRIRIVTVHHPLEQVPGDGRAAADGAGAALQGFSDAGADIVLSGHLHRSWITPFQSHPDLLFVQAGTLSTRTHGEKNSFNLLDLSPRQIRITTVSVDERGAFSESGEGIFVRDAARQWQRVGAGMSGTLEPG